MRASFEAEIAALLDRLDSKETASASSATSEVSPAPVEQTSNNPLKTDSSKLQAAHGALTKENAALRADAAKQSEILTSLRASLAAAEEKLSTAEREQVVHRMEASELAQQQQKSIEAAQLQATQAGQESAGLRNKVQQLELAKTRLAAQLEEASSAQAELKQEIDRLSADASHSSMLGLELADYRRSVDSLNARVRELEASVKHEQSQNQQHRARQGELEQELQKADEFKTKSKDREVKMKAAYDKVKKSLTDTQEQLTAKESAALEFTSQLEAKQRDEEALKVELADALVHLDQVSAKLRETEFQAEMSERDSSARIAKLRQQLHELTTEHAKVLADFEEFKTRARTVLKAKQETDSVSDPFIVSLRAEVDSLRQEGLTLQAKLKEREVAVDELDTENAQLQEKFRISTQELYATSMRYEEQLRQLRMSSDIVDKEQSRIITQLRSQNELLQKSTNQSRKEAELLEALRTRAEEIEDFKARLLEARERYEDLEHLHATQTQQMVALQKQVQHLSASTTSSASASSGSEEEHAPSVRPQQGLTSVADLASLLASGAATISSIVTAPAAPAPAPPTMSATEIQKLTDDLLAARKQISHLTQLLQETEETSMRLSDQASILKEEIRRQERNESRTGAANLEYLKNIVLKYLANYEEQEQLIPVLSMLLQFSPHELQHAKTARATHPPIPTTRPSAMDSIASFLPKWT
eukprot:m.874745 g.874745  ORF g.874745 m.874745 type:complete len:706 (+) comp59803_c0_seq14:3-2120(+)